MHGIYLYLYSAFLLLLSIFFIALALLPRKKPDYSARSGYSPKTLVMVPCKGYDIGLSENLRAAHAQNYRNYDLVAVVDSKRDTALHDIKDTKTKFIIFNYRNRGSRKVAALATAMRRFRNYDAYVILDSDVLVGKNWLGSLIKPLSDKRIGISTSYPVFLPVGGFWSKVKHAWGYVGQGLEEDSRTVFGWGGSLAFRRDLIGGNALSYFSNSISDDIALTRIAKGRKMKIAYVSEAEPVVRSDDNFHKFAEWSNRQTAIFVAATGNRRYGRYFAIYYGANVLLVVSAILLGIFAGRIFLLFLMPQLIGSIKLWRRSGYKAYIFFIAFILNFIYLLNVINAAGMKRISWRGTSYDLDEIRKMRRY